MITTASAINSFVCSKKIVVYPRDHLNGRLLSYLTGWTNVNLLYLPDSMEITSLEGLTLWWPEISQSKRSLAW